MSKSFRIIALLLAIFMTLPLLAACANRGATQSESIASSSPGGNKIAFDSSVPQSVDSTTFSYYIYDGSESLKEWLGGFGVMGYFYRITNSSRVAERILDRPIREFGGFGTEFVAITKECKLIRFPNIADVPEAKIIYLGEVPADASCFLTNGKAACYITGEELVGVSVTDGVEVLRQKIDGLKQIYFGDSVGIVCRTDERYYVFDTEKQEIVFTGIKFSEQTWENEAAYEVDEYFGKAD